MAHKRSTLPTTQYVFVFLFAVLILSTLILLHLYQVHPLYESHSHTIQIALVKEPSILDDVDLHAAIQYLADANITQAATSFPWYIFQIGFNKCGTSSLSRFFKDNDIYTVHYGRHNLHLYPTIVKNFFDHKSLIADWASTHRVYMDFEPASALIRVLGDDNRKHPIFSWQILFKQYTNSKFILNIRNSKRWLRSRYNHYGKRRGCFANECDRIQTLERTNMSVSDMEIITKWKHHWYQYNCYVINFFARLNESHNLLIFDVENDSIGRLIQFFDGYDLKLNATKWGHHNPTTNKTGSIEQKVQMDKWNALALRYSQLAEDDEDLKDGAEYWRIMNACRSRV
eukprot:112176_1